MILDALTSRDALFGLVQLAAVGCYVGVVLTARAITRRADPVPHEDRCTLDPRPPAFSILPRGRRPFDWSQHPGL